ncbi:MAG: radical SAM protein [Nitrospirae bacterium]|jgi:radical SAM protein with 4Fe4S-binding SPASM domain|nr:radical SAM protein [Nitrospirota bacterium]
MNYPKYVQFYPTLKCNQSCTFCFNNILDSSSYKNISLKDTYVLVDVLAKKGIAEIDVLGGEPLLLPWMKDFVSFVTGSGITVNISTNGSIPDALNGLMEVHSEFLNIGFSVHGFSETHNSLTCSDNFLKVITGVKNMVSAGKFPVVKSVLMRGNIDEIQDLVAFLAEIGIKKYYLMYEDIMGRKEQNAGFSFPEFWRFFSALKSHMKKTLDVNFVAASGFSPANTQITGRCSAGVQKIAIMPDGSVFPCNLFACFREFYLGNIFRDGLEQVWSNPILDFFRMNHPDNTCKVTTCKHFAKCRGGCPAHSYFFYRSLDAADPRCEIKK